jgi:hypothetical protein
MSMPLENYALLRIRLWTPVRIRAPLHNRSAPRLAAARVYGNRQFSMGVWFVSPNGRIPFLV